MKNLTKALGVVALAIMLVPLGQVVVAYDPITQSDLIAGQGGVLLPQSDSFDREGCEQECRSIFGVDPYAAVEPQYRRGGSYGSYYAYAACIAKCNRKFWKDFDKDMDNMDKNE